MFKSMKEIDEYLDSIKDNESYELMSFILGRGEQTGDFIHVENIGNIDKTIANIIKKLNAKDFVTLASCSGIKSEHKITKYSTPSPYISFIYDNKKAKIIQNIAKTLNIIFEESECYLQKAYIIRLTDKKNELSEDKLIALWNAFEIEVDNVSN